MAAPRAALGKHTDQDPGLGQRERLEGFAGRSHGAPGNKAATLAAHGAKSLFGAHVGDSAGSKAALATQMHTAQRRKSVHFSQFGLILQLMFLISVLNYK